MSNRENSAVVNIAGGLTINGIGSSSSLFVRHRDVGDGNGVASAIGTNNDGGTYGDLTITGLGSLATAVEYGTGIGAAGATMGNITITDVGEIRTSNGGGTGIGIYNGTCGTIDIRAEHLYGACVYSFRAGSVIDHGSSSLTATADYILLGAKPATASVGSYNINNSTYGTTISGTGAAVLNGTAYNATGRSYAANPSYLNREVFESFGTNANNNGDGLKLPGMVIHTGTKANQNLRVIINSMDTGTLGIQPLPVNPRDAAVASLDLIDSAIDYSLNENTRMGAYQTELSYTIANLTTASENTQSSESVIRDTDMAKAMMEHAKYNILSQSAQAMLAQANQNSSGVLSLLQ